MYKQYLPKTANSLLLKISYELNLKLKLACKNSNLKMENKVLLSTMSSGSCSLMISTHSSRDALTIFFWTVFMLSLLGTKKLNKFFKKINKFLTFVIKG